MSTHLVALTARAAAEHGGPTMLTGDVVTLVINTYAEHMLTEPDPGGERSTCAECGETIHHSFTTTRPTIQAHATRAATLALAKALEGNR